MGTTKKSSEFTILTKGNLRVEGSLRKRGGGVRIKVGNKTLLGGTLLKTQCWKTLPGRWKKKRDRTARTTNHGHKTTEPPKKKTQKPNKPTNTHPPPPQTPPTPPPPPPRTTHSHTPTKPRGKEGGGSLVAGARAKKPAKRVKRHGLGRRGAVLSLRPWPSGESVAQTGKLLHVTTEINTGG